MLWMKWKMVVDSLRGRRRRMPCSLWFLLLFAAGGLVLFIHLRDLSEMVQHQGPAGDNSTATPGSGRKKTLTDNVAGPSSYHTQVDTSLSPMAGSSDTVGVKLGSTPRQSRETLSTQDSERSKSDNYQDHQAAEGILSSLIPPMQFPHFEESRQMATTGSREQDIGSLHVSKRQRKLLKTSPPISHTNNNVSVSSSSPSSSSSVSSSSASVSFSPDILQARRKLMKDVCAKYKSRISKTITGDHVKHLYVEDKHKLLYCQVPKAGCSNWKRTLIVLAGKARNAQSLQHDTVHYGQKLRTLNTFDHQGIMQRLETYTKIIFVREPLERIVSAYRDKFENPNNYYHNLFGKPIISKYRVNPSLAALKTGNGVTFKEFVRYLLDVHRPVGMDIHWEQMNQLCHPCLIDYDFIGKFENMEEESNFLLRLTGAPPNITLPSFKDRNPTDLRTSLQITQKYFSQVSQSEKQRVYDFYYMDYMMFNYSKPFKDLY
ncbi:carbohydrate sulfotransferase 8-like isoform X2 [Dicentrarchus labrax]|uniref:carbohydrate sulfotransferase 8-like isoform X2 n=1 Tax=Dicentrarchus labrax TaxID=13489 RepID=UPI0021F566E1|nr:carbohydrate sulfotransferase 8-like isoform X2 [Dicentrarchus labrax]